MKATSSALPVRKRRGESSGTKQSAKKLKISIPGSITPGYAHCRYERGIWDLDRREFARDLLKQRLPFLKSYDRVQSMVDGKDLGEGINDKKVIKTIFLKLPKDHRMAMVRACKRWAGILAFDEESPGIRWKHDQSVVRTLDKEMPGKIRVTRNERLITIYCGCLDQKGQEARELYHAEFQDSPQKGYSESDPVVISSSEDEDEADLAQYSSTAENETGDSEDSFDYI